MYFTRYMRRVPQLVYHSQVGRNPVHLWIAITCKSPKYEGILLLATLPWSGISLILGCWSPMWSIISNTNNHLISSANRQGWSLTLNASISGKHETMKSLYFYSLVPLGFNMFPPFIFFPIIRCYFFHHSSILIILCTYIYTHNIYIYIHNSEPPKNGRVIYRYLRRILQTYPSSVGTRGDDLYIHFFVCKNVWYIYIYTCI